MNPISNQFPVFENIIEAVKVIKEFERDAPKFSNIIPPDLLHSNPIDYIGCNLDEDDFIATPLLCNKDDVEYYKLFNIDTGISSEYLTDFERYSLKPNLYNTNFLYRGQNKDYGNIKANLFRDSNKKYFLDDMIKVQELTAFIAMHPLVQLLGIKGFELRGKPTKFQTNLYGLAQHYYNKTTEVDFSSSIEVAGFFATTYYDNKSDSYLPVENGPESTGVLYALPISKSLAFNIKYGYHISSIGKQFCFKRPERQLGFLVDGSNGKDILNHKLLLRVEFKHNKEITNKIYDYFGKGKAIVPEDPLQKYWKKYRDIKNEPFSISNKAVELNKTFNLKETIDSIKSKLLTYRNEDGSSMFVLTDNEWPEFPREILEEYWMDIKNGWWEDEFCHNIYFLFGKRYKEELINLPKDPRYKFAFFG